MVRVMDPGQHIGSNDDLGIIHGGFTQNGTGGQIHQAQNHATGAQINGDTGYGAVVRTGGDTHQQPLGAVFKQDAAQVVFTLPNQPRQGLHEVKVYPDVVGVKI